MKKTLFLLALVFAKISFGQVDYKADFTKEKLISLFGDFKKLTITNTMYCLNPYEIHAMNIDKGTDKTFEWEDLGLKFFEQENLKKTKYTFSPSDLFSVNGNLRLILELTKENNELLFIRLEIDENLSVVEETILSRIKSNFHPYKKIFRSNPETGELLYFEHLANSGKEDFMRAVFFDRDMELVSSDEYSMVIETNANTAGSGLNLFSLFVVSAEEALININNQIYIIRSSDRIEPLELTVDRNLSSYMLRHTKDNGFVLVGLYSDYGQKDGNGKHGALVLDFDKTATQTSANYIDLPNKLLANAKNQLKGDFTSTSYGYLDLENVFVDDDGSVLLLTRTVPMKNNKGGIIVRENLNIISIKPDREKIQTNTLVSSIWDYQAFVNSEKTLKIIGIDSPKNYDKTGKHIPGKISESSSNNAEFVYMEYDKSTGKINSPCLLKFQNSELEIKGNILHYSPIYGNTDSIILNFFIYGKNKHLVGVL